MGKLVACVSGDGEQAACDDGFVAALRNHQRVGDAVELYGIARGRVGAIDAEELQSFGLEDLIELVDLPAAEILIADAGGSLDYRVGVFCLAASPGVRELPIRASATREERTQTS